MPGCFWSRLVNCSTACRLRLRPSRENPGCSFPFSCCSRVTWQSAGRVLPKGSKRSPGQLLLFQLLQPFLLLFLHFLTSPGLLPEDFPPGGLLQPFLLVLFPSAPVKLQTGPNDQQAAEKGRGSLWPGGAANPSSASPAQPEEKSGSPVHRHPATDRPEPRTDCLSRVGAPVPRNRVPTGTREPFPPAVPGSPIPAPGPLSRLPALPMFRLLDKPAPAASPPQGFPPVGTIRWPGESPFLYQP